jgi:hypothetical protein
MRTNDVWWVLFRTGVLVLALLGVGCGPALVSAGADMAAGGASSGTERVAAGGGPGATAAAGVVVGVAAMAGGYMLTKHNQRRPPAPPSGVPAPTHRRSPYPGSRY